MKTSIVPLTVLVMLTACAYRPGTYPDNKAKKKIACVGDSITQGNHVVPTNKTYPNQLQKLLGNGYEVRNYGVAGTTLMRNNPIDSYWSTDAYLDAKDCNPNTVIIFLGANDTKAKYGTTKSQFSGDYKELVKEFLLLPKTKDVFVCTLCPVRDGGYAGINEAAAEDERGWIKKLPHAMDVFMGKDVSVELIDMHAALKSCPASWQPDNVHPDAQGSAILAKTACTAIINSRASGVPSPCLTLEDFFHAWFEGLISPSADRGRHERSPWADPNHRH